jgi:hypothetical protein
MILEIGLIVFAIPIGFLISYLARDELIKGRLWFKLLALASLVVSISFYFKQGMVIGNTSLFVFILSGVSYLMSFSSIVEKVK